MRVWEQSDLQLYTDMNSDSEVMKYFPEKFRPGSEQSLKSVNNFMKHYEDHGFTYFATDYLPDNTFIGFIGMKWIEYEVFFGPAIDIGWRLRKEYWGKGLATEGAKACLEYYFQNFNQTRIVSLTPVKNYASEKVMKKIGMKKVSTFKHPLIDQNDNLCEHVLYEVNEDDFAR